MNVYLDDIFLVESTHVGTYLTPCLVVLKKKKTTTTVHVNRHSSRTLNDLFLL